LQTAESLARADLKSGKTARANLGGAMLLSASFFDMVLDPFSMPAKASPREFGQKIASLRP